MTESLERRPLPPRRERPQPRPDLLDSPAVARPAVARAAGARPDARPMRMLLGLTGVAALSALVTTIAAPPAPSQITTSVAEVQAVPSAQVTHVTRYVQLKPGQTAPPSAQVQTAPAATPRVVVVTTTRQSGKP